MTVEAVVRIDEKGRLLIPKKIRELAGLTPGSLARIRAEEGRVVVEPLGSVAERFYGVFRVGKAPKDIDRYLEEAVAECLSRDM